MTEFHRDTRSRLTVTIVSEFDLTDSTVKIKVDGQPHLADWDGPVTRASEDSEQWQRIATTSDYFAGPDADEPGSATILDAGSHPVVTLVTTGSRVVPDTDSPLVVPAA